jgi:hypothetical protein
MRVASRYCEEGGNDIHIMLWDLYPRGGERGKGTRDLNARLPATCCLRADLPEPGGLARSWTGTTRTLGMPAKREGTCLELGLLFRDLAVHRRVFFITTYYLKVSVPETDCACFREGLLRGNHVQHEGRDALSAMSAVKRN